MASFTCLAVGTRRQKEHWNSLPQSLILQNLRLTSLRDDKAGEQMIRDFKQEKVNVTRPLEA